MLLGDLERRHKVVLYPVQIEVVEHDVDEALLILLSLLHILLLCFRRFIFFGLWVRDLVLDLSDHNLEQVVGTLRPHQVLVNILGSLGSMH